MFGSVILALGLALAPTFKDVETPCFDWAVVAKLTEQKYLGHPQTPPGTITLDSIKEWKATVRSVVVGRDVPGKLSLQLVIHGELLPWAANQVVLFGNVGQEGKPTLLKWRLLPRGLKRHALGGDSDRSSA